MDIHKLKLVANMHFAKIDKTYVCLVFSTKSYDTFWLKAFEEGKTTQGDNYNTKCFNHMLSRN